MFQSSRITSVVMMHWLVSSALWCRSSAMVTMSSRYQLLQSLASSSYTDSCQSMDPLVVCGPSGVGKGTIIAEFMKKYGTPSNSFLSFGFCVSHTTRSARPGEVDGVHYHFLPSEQDFHSLVAQDYFLETAQVHGNYYGTSWNALQHVQAQGKKALLDIDVQGVQRLRQNVSRQARLQPKFIFIAPPSLNVLHERLTKRNTETAEALQRRLGNAAAELDYGMREGNFDAIVTNDDLDTAVEEFCETVRLLYAL